MGVFILILGVIALALAIFHWIQPLKVTILGVIICLLIQVILIIFGGGEIMKHSSRTPHTTGNAISYSETPIVYHC